jgi:hypothetical protein
MREMFMGADETAPDRPGRHLETPQLFGILPTLAFWNRRDVWRHARWFIAPVAGSAALFVGYCATLVGPGELPLVGLASGVPVVLVQGLLERYIRRARARRCERLPMRQTGS